MSFLPHVEGSLNNSEMLIFYWFNDKWEEKISEIHNIANSVFYPFGKIKKIFEISENINYEKLKNYKEYIKNKTCCFFTDTHEKAYYLIKFYKSLFPNLKILIFDAHPDCFYDKDKVNYQNYLYYLIKENIIQANDVMIIGIRNYALEEIEFLKENKIKYISSFSIIENFNKTINDIRTFIQNNNVFISLDLDVLSCKACNWIEPLGLNEREIYKIIKLLKPQIRAIEFTEINFDAPKEEKIYYIKYCLYIILLLASVKT